LETPPEFLEFILKKIVRFQSIFNLFSAEKTEKTAVFGKRRRILLLFEMDGAILSVVTKRMDSRQGKYRR